jgi:hypothetical protein
MRFLQSVVRHAGSIYGIIKVKYKGNSYPVLLNGKDYHEIKNLNKTFHVDQFGQVYCTHLHNNIEKKIYIHHIVLAINDRKYLKSPDKKVIYHMNHINLDNRLSNLTKIKPPNNTPKTRIIQIADANVTPDTIPKYVSYMKPNNTHGERFVVKFNNITWKSTGSKKLSLKYKLEQTKKFLRTILSSNKILKDLYFQEATKQEIDSVKTYNTIVRKAGYQHIKQKINKNTNNKMLQYNAKGLSKEEKVLLNKFTIDPALYQTNSPIIP